MRLYTLLTIALISCASSTSDNQHENSEVSELIRQFNDNNNDFSETKVNELTFVQDITVTDSLIIYKSAGGSNSNAEHYYNKFHKDLQIQIDYYRKSTGQKKETYYNKIERQCDKINEFVAASKGEAESTEWDWIFNDVNRLKEMEPTEVIGKLYQARLTYMKKFWHEGSNRNSSPHGDGKEQVTETRYFSLNSTESKVIRVSSTGLELNPTIEGIQLVPINKDSLLQILK